MMARYDPTDDPAHYGRIPAGSPADSTCRWYDCSSRRRIGSQCLTHTAETLGAALLAFLFAGAATTIGGHVAFTWLVTPTPLVYSLLGVLLVPLAAFTTVVTTLVGLDELDHLTER